MTDKTTEALKRVEVWVESLTGLHPEVSQEQGEILSSIREALTNHSGKANEICRMRCFVNGVTEYYDEQGNVTMRLDCSEPVKQEPVAVISESAIGLVKLHANGVSLPFGTPLYAAPVSAKEIQRCPCCGSDYFAGSSMVDLDKAIKNDPLYLQGRAEALEEAAKVCEEAIAISKVSKELLSSSEVLERAITTGAIYQAEKLAAAIRSLK